MEKIVLQSITAVGRNQRFLKGVHGMVLARY